MKSKFLSQDRLNPYHTEVCPSSLRGSFAEPHQTHHDGFQSMRDFLCIIQIEISLTVKNIYNDFYTKNCNNTD